MSSGPQKTNGNGNGNGNGDGEYAKTLPPSLRFLWLVLNRLGLATLLVIGAAAAGGYWLTYVSAPEAAARLKLLEQSTENGTRMLTVLDKIVSNEELQIRWQQEWKAYIEAQHKMRCEESKAIIAHQQKAELLWEDNKRVNDSFFKRTDEIHQEQIKVLAELATTVRDLKKLNGRETSNP